MIRIACLTFLLFCTALLHADEYKQELKLTAAELLSLSTASNARLSADGKSLELLRGQLLEDDGAAAGFSYKANEELLSDEMTAVKKLFIKLPRPRIILSHGGNLPLLPPKAHLLVGHTGKDLHATINGKSIALGEPKKAGNYWKVFEIPVGCLVEGSNEVALSGTGKLWIARHDERVPTLDAKRMQRSHKQYKSGQESRISENLGPNNDIAGEYYVRLLLDGYMQDDHKVDRSLITVVLDAANFSGRGIPAPNVKLKSLSIAADGEWGKTHGPTLMVNSRDRKAGGNEIEEAHGSFGSTTLDLNETTAPRFFDLEMSLPAIDTGKSSRLRTIKITAVVEEHGSWSKQPRIIAQSNQQLGASTQFNFEDLKHPRLAEFRQQYALDEVVKGCTTDLQRMEKLAVWTSQQWTKGHLGKIYPKWDALEILKKHEDGTPIGGFCQQYNIVFLQACESFGMVGRCVSIGAGDHGVKIRSGHEVVEIWSNELSKWVYVDGQAAWYFVDKETRTPLNLLELRDRQLAAIFDKSASKESKREVDVVVLAKSPYEWKGLQEWPAFTELRMIPHTSFLDGKAPLPLNQGMRGWFWTGHRVWTDELYPASVLYSDRVSNVNDWNWSVNQTRIWLQQNVKAGTLDVRLNHNMPSFAKFVAWIDGEAEKDVSKGEFTWPLRAGENRLQVQAVNVHGIRGPASWIKVEYKP